MSASIRPNVAPSLLLARRFATKTTTKPPSRARIPFATHLAETSARPTPRPEPSRAKSSTRPDPDPLEPTARRLAELAPPFGFQAGATTPAESVPTRARISLEELMPQLVRRIAWAGDRRRGSVQLELGSGPHAGMTITVHADDGRVRVKLDGSGADELRGRIAERLDRRGLQVDSIT